MVFPFLNMLSVWFFLVSCHYPDVQLLRSWWSYWSRLDALSSSGHYSRHTGSDMGILDVLASLAVFIVAFTMGGLNYVTTILQARYPRHDPDAHASVHLGYFCCHGSWSFCLSGAVCRFCDDAVR